MILPTRVRKHALTAHVAASVGWLGAVAVFLALSLAGWMSPDPAVVRGAYLLMDSAARAILVPFAIASLVSGVVLGLGTPWGLFRHYWVFFKLLITTLSTLILLIYLDTFAGMAGLASDPAAEIHVVRNPSPAVHSALALLVLGVAFVLGMYKPKGLTPWGWRAIRISGAKNDRQNGQDR